jgi:type II secretory pathway component PulF
MNLKKQFLFVKKIESFYKSGKPLLEIFNSLSQTEPNATLRRGYTSIASELREGSSLFQALSKQDDILDHVYVKLIQIGETSGKLDEVLNEILELQRSLIAVRKKIVAASIYPVLLLGIYVFIFALLIVVIIPALAGFMLKYGQQPPAILMGFLFLNKLVFSPPALCAAPFAILLLSVMLYIFLNVEELSWFRSRAMLFIPGFGRLDRFKNMYAYIFTMKICYDAGLSPLNATELSAHNVSNVHLFENYAEIYDYVNKGDNLSTAFMKTNLFNHDIIDLVRVGEESGKLEEAYKEIISIIDEKIQTTIAVMVAMIKPLGVAFGFFFLCSIFATVFVIIFSILGKIKSVLPQ